MTALRRRDTRGRSPIDIHVGARVRLRRTMLRMSQEQLAAALGLTFQQVQKYEHATNRVSASRLYQLCRIFKVPISFFFEDIDAKVRTAHSFGSPKPAQLAPGQDDPLRQPDIIDLIDTYYRISSPRLRARFLKFVRELADSGENSKRRGRPRKSPVVRNPRDSRR